VSLSSNLTFFGLTWPSCAVTQKAEGTNMGAGSTWPKGSIPWKGHSELAPLDARYYSVVDETQLS